MLQNNFPYYAVPKYRYPINQKTDPTNHLIFSEIHLRKLLNMAPFTQVLGGHHTRCFVNYQSVVKKSIFRFTFLRDPVSRYLSHLNYHRRVMGIQWELQDFLKTTKFNNWQTLRIAGEANVEKAKEFLNSRFDFVGLTEKFDESLLIFQEKLNSDLKRSGYEKSNVTKEETGKDRIITFDSLRESEKVRVLENNQLDSELYQYTSSVIFNNYLKSYNENLNSRLIEFNNQQFDFNLNKVALIKNKIFRRYLNLVCVTKKSLYRF